MENKLELLFNIESSKRKLELLTWKEKQVDRWNRDLKKINNIYEELSFLNSKGIKIEKVCCTEFNEKDACNGFYPYLRLPQFLACFHPIHDDENFDFGGRANGELDGKFSCETLVIKLAKYIR
jgi:hypothetical protein